MAIKIGNIAAADIYAGGDHVAEIYLGSTKVWPTGRLVYFNQLFNPPASYGSNGITYTYTDGIATISGTASTYYAAISSGFPDNVADHQYYFALNVIKDDDDVLEGTVGLYLFNRGAGDLINDKHASFIYTNTNTGLGRGWGLRKMPTGGVLPNIEGCKICVMQIDLTLMFGAGNEPTLAEFETLFPNTYYPYNPGEWIII